MDKWEENYEKQRFIHLCIKKVLDDLYGKEEDKMREEDCILIQNNIIDHIKYYEKLQGIYMLNENTKERLKKIVELLNQLHEDFEF